MEIYLRSMEFLKFTFGIFLIALVTLAYEIALSYEFSFIFWFNVSFAVISISMFGLGVGSVIGYFISPSTKQGFGRLLYYSSILFGLTIVLALSLIAYGSRSFYHPATSTGRLGFIETLAFFSLASAIPFLFAGICLSVGLNYPSTDKRVISMVYFSDLIGAGIGSFILTFLLPFIGLEKIVILSGLLAVAVAPLFLERVAKRDYLPLLIILIAGSFILINFKPLAMNFVPEAGSDKLLSTMKKDGADILATQWTSVSRVDVVNETNGSPIKFIVNGNFPVSAFKAEGFKNWVERDARFLGFTLNPESVMVIGSGGGMELAMGRHVNARKIVGVEILPFIVQYTKNDLHEYSDSIYNQPGIETVIEDGRTYVNRADEQYDLIQNTVIGNNGLVVPTSTLLNFQDAYVYTKEANRDYYRRLSADGVALSVTYGRLDEYNIIDLEKGVTYYTLRQYLTVKEALQEEGVDYRKHMMMFRHPQAPSPGASPTAQADFTLIFKEELTPKKVKFVMERAAKYGMQPIFAPYYDGSLDMDSISSSLPSWRDVSPVVDDKPFFYHTEKEPPWEIRAMLRLLVVMTLVFIILPIAALKGVNFRYKLSPMFLLYFLCLGVGYILVEAVTIQKLTLFLGRPAYAFQVVLFGMLVFSGIGSFLTGTTNVSGNKLQRLSLVVLSTTTLALVIFTYLLPRLVYGFMSLGILIKILLAVLFIAPVALLMGMPFPLGLRIVSSLDPKNVIWMYGVNGAGSVMGSIIGMIIAFKYGFTYSLLTGSAIYALALVAMLALVSKLRSGPSAS